jgi:predicted thioesterase
VRADDGVREIGAGTHGRAVIDIAKFVARLG